ncbi:MAG: hypothetical protein HYY91_05035 [Candidatus Omnitrophica bacterium]|nr:hypothetical protein [Candidatus Omnitrophota bacterium]
MSRDAPLIAISVPLGYYARNLLRSGILEHLLAAQPPVQVLILSPAAAEAEFLAEFQRDGQVRCSPLPGIPPAPTLLDRAYWKTRLMVRRSRAASLGLAALGQQAYFRRQPRYYTALLAGERPSLVVTGSPGFHSNRDIPIIREAQWHGVPVLCLVHSWDNLATHPVTPTRPDHLAVWNGAMREEAIAKHFFPPEAVSIVGPPHFDLYQDPDTFVPREAYCRGLGLNPAKRILVVAASDNTFIDNTFVLDLLRDAFSAGALSPSTAQVVVRPHPLDTTGAFDRYRGDPLFAFDHPARWSDALRWNPDRGEMHELANTLKHGDVILNVASTVALEAAILDRPIVNVCFSPTQPARFKQWVLEFHYGGHYKPIKDHACSVMAMSARELVAGVQTYLAHPERHRRERRAMAEALCYRLDGQASRRAAELILRLAGHRAGSGHAAAAAR